MEKTNLINSLINASEKSSNIARICRSNKKLLSYLVQEKTGDEANARFKHDFKTLADVLIQETIKKDINTLFPNICIKGEESPNFTNADGTVVKIEIGSTVAETKTCLETIMQDVEAAEALAVEVHNHVKYTSDELGVIPTLPDNINYENLGIWIDPIDATAEYISGNNISTKFSSISEAGLDCVTVLIGVYERDIGVPVIGVISQPFCKRNDGDASYQSHIVWGVALPELKAHNCDYTISTQRSSLLAICSSSEKKTILNGLVEAGFNTVFSAGAGYKALKVIQNDADVYIVLSKGTTFKWDTCAPHAILRALNGDVFDFLETIKQQCPVSLSYLEQENESIDIKCNAGGIIAVRDLELLKRLLPILKN